MSDEILSDTIHQRQAELTKARDSLQNVMGYFRMLGDDGRIRNYPRNYRDCVIIETHLKDILGTLHLCDYTMTLLKVELSASEHREMEG